jgi:prophage regulatory protein
MGELAGIYNPNAQPAVKHDPVVTLRRVTELTSLGRRTIYDLIHRGEFPKPIKLTNMRIGWRLSVVNGWITQREQK